MQRFAIQIRQEMDIIYIRCNNTKIKSIVYINIYFTLFYFLLLLLSALIALLKLKRANQKSISPLNTRKLSPNSLNPITQR